MKYGLPSVPWGHNIGDAVQSMLLHDLYKEHGIEKVEYVPVGMSSKYKGEKMVLPLNACHVYGGPQDARKFAQSEDIDYRYLGFHLHGDLRSFGDLVQLKSDYPIGCRDVPTRDFLRKLGYNAYFSGCISMTLPKRPDGDYKLVYVIDDDAKTVNCLIAEGCEIYGTVKHSVVSVGCTIGKNAIVEDSVVMPGVVIEEGAIVRHAILGENSKVEKNAVVGGCDKKDISVTAKGAVVKENTVLAAGEMI